MKRAQQEEQRCRRMEFKCKLYSIIKDLDRSMKSECGRFKPPPSQGGGFSHMSERAASERKQKGSQCCCPPGCCQESLEFRLPRLLPKEDPSGWGGSDDGSQDSPGTEHLWHNEDHSWGCRPVGEGGPGSQRGGVGGGRPNSDSGPGVRGGSPGCGEGSPGFGGGCCTYSPNYEDRPDPSPKAFQFPQSPEEAILRGCFVARSV